MMTEYEVRELCERFFDAYENKRADILDELYSDDCIIWHNVFGKDTTREDNIAGMRVDKGQRRRTYNDRVINVFHDGFVIQYSLNGVMHDGHVGPALWICIVGKVRDGKITRIDEYMDSSKFGAWAGRGVARSDGRRSKETSA
jgi:ketosteroid isomerase-like protein